MKPKTVPVKTNTPVGHWDNSEGSLKIRVGKKGK